MMRERHDDEAVRFVERYRLLSVVVFKASEGQRKRRNQSPIGLSISGRFYLRYALVAIVNLSCELSG